MFVQLNQPGLSDDVAKVMSVLPSFAGKSANLAEVADGWWHFFSLMQASRRAGCANKETNCSARYLENPEDREALQKLIRLNAAFRRAEGGEHAEN